ncbi:MAG: DUF4856 domain-containing protein [Saprospiraceae bacterium]
MNTRLLLVFSMFVFSFAACDDDTTTPIVEIENPATYNFTRAGQSTVSFGGQTTRIQMGEELISALKTFDTTEDALLNMYANANAPFSSADLNDSDKSIKSKTAASADYFSANTATAAQIKAEFESWMQAQVVEVFPNENELAEAGKAGQIADGTSARYINAQGLEYDQLVGKGLIGALMLDQTLNNYLSPAVLDAATNVADNDAEVVLEDKNYTSMEHKWDEAYGYVYGTAQDATNPNATIGEDDSFMNKYIARVNGDTDFTGIADDIFEAFKLGRAAIVAGEYELRDEQAAILQEKLSEMIAIRAVYYLIQGKINIENGETGSAFHDLSEGYGFIYSLQFTRKPNTDQPYFSGEEVDAFLTDLLDDGANGLWDVAPATLDNLAETIAAQFDFTVAQAASND